MLYWWIMNLIDVCEAHNHRCIFLTPRRGLAHNCQQSHAPTEQKGFRKTYAALSWSYNNWATVKKDICHVDLGRSTKAPQKVVHSSEQFTQRDPLGRGNAIIKTPGWRKTQQPCATHSVFPRSHGAVSALPSFRRCNARGGDKPRHKRCSDYCINWVCLGDFTV